MSNESESFEDDRPAAMKLQGEYRTLLSTLGSCDMGWQITATHCHRPKGGNWQYDWRVMVCEQAVRTFPATEMKNDAPQRGILAVFDLQRETADISAYYCNTHEYTLLCGFAAQFGLKVENWDFEDIPF
tara:strand:- start:1099 stop:1485 length:387 start_codon:yes stop_codon:yes gene_type:complete